MFFSGIPNLSVHLQLSRKTIYKGSFSIIIVAEQPHINNEELKNMALRIKGRGEDDGANICYKLSDGQIVTTAQGVAMQKRGELPGYNVITVKGVEYLRDNPDTREEDNIDSQPLIQCP